MVDGRVPILRADYSKIWSWNLNNIHNVASLGFASLTIFMPSIFYAAGAFGYLAFGIFCNNCSHPPKFTSDDAQFRPQNLKNRPIGKWSVGNHNRRRYYDCIKIRFQIWSWQK